MSEIVLLNLNNEEDEIVECCGIANSRVWRFLMKFTFFVNIKVSHVEEENA